MLSDRPRLLDGVRSGLAASAARRGQARPGFSFIPTLQWELAALKGAHAEMPRRPPTHREKTWNGHDARDADRISVSPGRPVTARGKRTREALIEAGRRVLDRDGFYGAKISDIAKEAGSSIGTFYWYFSSKEQIFREIAQRVLMDMFLPSPSPRPDGEDPRRAIAEANRSYLLAYQRNAQFMRTLEQVAARDELGRDAHHERQLRYVERIRRSIQRLQREGLADDEVDAEYTAVALASMLSRFAYISFVLEDESALDIDRAVDVLTHVWASAIGSRSLGVNVESSRRPVASCP